MASKKFIDTASAESLVRFGPELSALKALLASSQTDYRRGLHLADASAANQRGAANYAASQLQGIYGSNPVAGIPGLSRAIAMNQVNLSGVRAEESAAGMRRTALEQLRGDQAKILGRRQDISQEIGAFTTSEADKLSSAAAQRDLTNRISLRSNATRQSEGAANRKNARTVARIRTAGKGTPSATAAKVFEDKFGVKLQTGVSHNALRSKVDSTAAVIRDQVSAGNKDRRQLGQLLTLGRTSKTVDVNGQKVTLPAISKTDPFVASVALDLALDGHVSNRNARETHRRGYSVKALGLPNRAPVSSLATSLAAAIGA